MCEGFDELLEQRRRDCPEQRNVIDRFVAPLWATKPLQRGVMDPQAFGAELIDGIAARNFAPAVLDRGLTQARQERSTMPSLPEALKLLDGIAREANGSAPAPHDPETTRRRVDANPHVAWHLDGPTLREAYKDVPEPAWPRQVRDRLAQLRESGQ